MNQGEERIWSSQGLASSILPSVINWLTASIFVIDYLYGRPSGEQFLSLTQAKIPFPSTLVTDDEVFDIWYDLVLSMSGYCQWVVMADRFLCSTWDVGLAWTYLMVPSWISVHIRRNEWSSWMSCMSSYRFRVDISFAPLGRGGCARQLSNMSAPRHVKRAVLVPSKYGWAKV